MSGNNADRKVCVIYLIILTGPYPLSSADPRFHPSRKRPSGSTILARPLSTCRREKEKVAPWDQAHKTWWEWLLRPSRRQLLDQYPKENHNNNATGAASVRRAENDFHSRCDSLHPLSRKSLLSFIMSLWPLTVSSSHWSKVRLYKLYFHQSLRSYRIDLYEPRKKGTAEGDWSNSTTWKQLTD